MCAKELAGLVDTWADAQNIAEIINNPRFQVTEQWDFREWQAIESQEGLTFQRVAAEGAVLESVRIDLCDATHPSPSATQFDAAHS